MAFRTPLFRSGLVLFLAVLALYATSPVVTNGDSYMTFPTAVSLVHDGNLDLDEFTDPAFQSHYAIERVDGRSYDAYPWVVSLFAVPAVLAADALHAVGLARSAPDLVRRDEMGLVQLASASVVTAAVVLVVFLMAYDRLPSADERRRRRLALAIAVVFATGTAAWSTASRALWQHGPSMLMVGLAVLFASRLDRGTASRWQVFGLGVAMAASTAIRPTNVVVAALLGIWVVGCQRQRLLAVVAGGAAVGVPWLAVNLITFGQPLSYYSSPGQRLVLHDRYLEAVAANLVSTARGLFVFSPVVVLAVAGLVVRWRAHKLNLLDGLLAASVVLQLLVVAASREAWWAGHSFGPRFMSDVLPVLAYLSVPAVDAAAAWRGWPRVALVAAVVWSVVVNAQGAYLRAANCWNAVPVDVDVDRGRVWSLSQPQVIEGWRVFFDSPKRAVVGPCEDPSAAAGALGRHL